MRQLNVLPTTEWAQPDTGDPSIYWLRNPLSGYLHNPNAVPAWVSRTRGAGALRQCVSVIRFVVESSTSVQSLNEAGLTHLADGIAVAGWVHARDRGRVALSAAEQVAFATNSRMFNPRVVRDPVAEQTKNAVIGAANDFSRQARQLPRDRSTTALGWAAHAHGMDMLGWSTLISAGEAVLDEWMTSDPTDGRVGVLVGLTPNYLDVITKARLLGIEPECIQTSIVGEGWNKVDAEGAFTMAEIQRAGFIDVDTL